MGSRIQRWLSISLFSLLTGCVTHAPVSDTFIFQDAEPNQRITKHTRMGLSLNHGLSYEVAQKASNTEWPQFESRLQPLNQKQRAVGLYILNYDKERKSSFALTLGTFSAGLDITFKVFGLVCHTKSQSRFVDKKLFILSFMVKTLLGQLKE